MSQINNPEELRGYILESLENDTIEIPKVNYGIPYVLINNPENTTINAKKSKFIPQNDKFVLYQDGTIDIVTPEKAKHMTPSNLTEKDIKIPTSEKMGAIVVSSHSPNTNILLYELKKNEVPFSMTTATNQRTNDSYTRIDFSKNKSNASKIKEINSNVKEYGIPNAKKLQPTLESDTYEITHTSFHKPKPKYKEEQIRIPEQEKDNIQRKIEEINNSVRKCEIFLGQMRDAQMTSNKKQFDIAKGSLQKEFKNLKKLETEIIKDNREDTLYEKAIALQNIQTIEKELNTLTMFNRDGPEKTLNKINQLKTNYYIIHLNDMLSIRENLSMQEQLGVTAALGNVNSHGEGYTTETNIAHKGATAKDNNDTVLSDNKDGSYNTNYAGAGSADPNRQELYKESNKDLDPLSDKYNPPPINIGDINQIIENEFPESEYEERKLHGV